MLKAWKLNVFLMPASGCSAPREASCLCSHCFPGHAPDVSLVFAAATTFSKVRSMTALPLLFFLFTQPVDDPWRVRLTETSITETGRATDAPDDKLQTRGFGFGIIAPAGFGLHYTSLVTYDLGDPKSQWNHRYLDASYTFGRTFLVTTGGGLGVGASSGDAKNVFLGPGFAVGSFEAYWIHRRNWLKAEGVGTIISKHYQLGLGWRL